MKFPKEVKWGTDCIIDEFLVSKQGVLVLETIRPLVDLGILETHYLDGPKLPDFYLNDRLVVSVMSKNMVLIRRDFVDE